MCPSLLSSAFGPPKDLRSIAGGGGERTSGLALRWRPVISVLAPSAASAVTTATAQPRKPAPVSRAPRTPGSPAQCAPRYRVPERLLGSRRASLRVIRLGVSRIWRGRFAVERRRRPARGDSRLRHAARAVAAGQAAVTSARHCNLWSGHNVEAAATGIPRQIGPTAQHY